MVTGVERPPRRSRRRPRSFELGTAAGPRPYLAHGRPRPGIAPRARRGPGRVTPGGGCPSGGRDRP
ncbi:hypothetical protein SGL43_04354 [Streptomyces globisporus]|uniref:Uncharacterized protein n=1 Tax=Streptomyces globisporus TaxID=1908 RepID=A0ABN8V5N8_STRGL|nr:hypothetical protein SGL43_04354 [Streptomyces globisporus]